MVANHCGCRERERERDSIKKEEYSFVRQFYTHIIYKQSGITLISLIITVIILLILSTISITIAVNGNLLKKAENSSTQTMAEIGEARRNCK